MPTVDQQRLAFGRVAELYDRARPSYPPAAIDELIAFAGLRPGDRILEVGAGTGKATVLLAARGLGVLALEPSPPMAARARANCARWPAVEVVEAEFERWRPRDRLPALVSAAAWHWIAPEVRYQRAREALLDGGTLAAIWTFPDWTRCTAREPLSRAYRSAAPELAADFPMHPDSRPDALSGDWPHEISAAEGFRAPVVRVHRWWQEYTAAAYTDLLRTHQDHILLDEHRRAALLGALSAAIERGGGAVRMPYATRLCLATRA